MEYANEILLFAVALVLIALLFSKPSKPAESSQSELKWLRRKIDALHLQLTGMVRHLGILDKPSTLVKHLLEKGNEMDAAQKLREETGLDIKEAKEIVRGYKQQLGKPEAANAESSPPQKPKSHIEPILNRLDTLSGQVAQLAARPAKTGEEGQGELILDRLDELAKRIGKMKSNIAGRQAAQPPGFVSHGTSQIRKRAFLAISRK